MPARDGQLHSFLIETDKQPGEVVGKAVSRADGTGGLYQVELLNKDKLSQENAGIHPWSVEGDSESRLLLFNYSKQDRVFSASISNGQIQWNNRYALAPSETREISIKQLIEDKIPDSRGKILAANLQSGTVQWMVPNAGEGTGRLMVSSRSQPIAQILCCGADVVVCDLELDVYSNWLVYGASDFPWDVDPEFCGADEPGQCYGTEVGFGSADYSWTIGAAGILASNELSSPEPLVTAVGVGTGYGDVTASAGGCQASGGANATVQIPASLRLVKAPPTILQQGNNNSTNGCALGYYGIMLDVDYQVLDQNGAPISSANMEPQENVPGVTAGYQDIGPSRINTTSKFTRTDGTFDDAPVGVCSAVPFNTPITQVQSVQILLNGTAYAVRTNNYEFSSTNLPNHGTITNGVDINATQ